MEQLREGYDKIEARIGTMYEDKLDRRITQDMYDRKVKEYKEKQTDLILQMEEHSNADEDFYLNAVRVLNLASRALEIFKSSETDEKRVLLNFLLQNPVLEGKTLQFELKKPFDSILECTQTGNWLPSSKLIQILEDWNYMGLLKEKLSEIISFSKSSVVPKSRLVLQAL